MTAAALFDSDAHGRTRLRVFTDEKSRTPGE
jgi:hypothetical protein